MSAVYERNMQVQYTSANSFLKKNEFGFEHFGGGAENRTPVQTSFLAGVYKLSYL